MLTLEPFYRVELGKFRKGSGTHKVGRGKKCLKEKKWNLVWVGTTVAVQSEICTTGKKSPHGFTSQKRGGGG